MMPAIHIRSIRSVVVLLLGFVVIGLSALSAGADGKRSRRARPAPRITGPARIQRTPIRRSMPRIGPRRAAPAARARVPRSRPAARPRATLPTRPSHPPAALGKRPADRASVRKRPAAAALGKRQVPGASRQLKARPGGDARQLPARAASRPSFLERHGVNPALRRAASHAGHERQAASPQRRSDRRRDESLSRLRRLSTRDIERIPTRDGTLSRLRLGDRPEAHRARNSFFHRHSPTVMHDHRRDRFYRITPEGNLRRITNPSVLSILRRREAERQRREAGRPERRWHAASGSAAHRVDRHRDEHHEARHNRHKDRDHFYFGFAVGDWYYPYRSFYLGYHRGYYPHYVPYHYYHHAWPWSWYYDPFTYGYYGYVGEDWSVSVAIALGAHAPLWCVPYAVPAPVVLWPYVLGPVTYTNVYNIWAPPSAATYNVDGSTVASTLPPQQQQPQAEAPRAVPPSTDNPPPPAGASESATTEGDRELLDEFAALAEEAFRQGNYERAARLWRHALVEDPQNGLLLLLMGQALFATGKYREAAGAVQAGLALLEEKNWNVVVANWRELYGKPEDYTKHLRALEKAIQQNPNDPALRFLVGYHYGFLGYPKEAARELGYLKQLAPKDKIGLRLYEIMKARAEGKQPPASAKPSDANKPVANDGSAVEGDGRQLSPNSSTEPVRAAPEQKKSGDDES